MPGVRTAVKWNPPFYGRREGWFFSYHCFTHYVKATYFRGTSLDPVPPGASKYPEARYLDSCKGDDFEAPLADWMRQASKLPGERL